MNEIDLFIALEKNGKAELLKLLQDAYFEMNAEQRQSVFGSYVSNKIANTRLEQADANDILNAIKDFYKEYIAGAYYSPFNINSKNYRKLPEETKKWYNQIDIFLEESSQLTKQGFHNEAIQCFQILFDLIDKLDKGDDEIIFGDEIGILDDWC